MGKMVDSDDEGVRQDRWQLLLGSIRIMIPNHLCEI